VPCLSGCPTAAKTGNMISGKIINSVKRKSGTKIQWTDETVNFWVGCEKCSLGCKFCYMYRNESKYGKNPTEVRRTGYSTFGRARFWSIPKRIFTCSYSDFFIDKADEWRGDAWEEIRETPQHQWQILTKRPQRIIKALPSDWGENGYHNVWLGVSVESQEYMHRVDELLKVPAAIRFISVEPLIAPVSFKDYNSEILKKIDWVIIGGESGWETGLYRYRKCEIEWIKSIIDECRLSGTKVFVKQLGSDLAKRLGLKEKFGGDMNEWEKSLQIREFPE
jgi:protein gp37